MRGKVRQLYVVRLLGFPEWAWRRKVLERVGGRSEVVVATSKVESKRRVKVAGRIRKGNQIMCPRDAAEVRRLVEMRP